MVKYINKINSQGFKLCKLQTNPAAIAVTVKKKKIIATTAIMESQKTLML